MKRSSNALLATLALALLALGLVLVTPSTARAESANANANANANDSIEIACWGDSMTHGNGSGLARIFTKGKTYNASNKSYPEILQDLTGATTHNYGIPGGTSLDILALQRGVAQDFGDDEFNAVAQSIMEESAAHPGNILVLEIGSNGGWDNDYSELISQYWSMINYAGCQKYLIIGDTDDPGTSIGDRMQEPFSNSEGPGETAWETALRKEFGDHFINMRTYLIEHGLEACNMQANNQDAACAQYGMVPHRLRSDWTHLNSFGYYAQAYGVYERGLALGYWS